MANASNGNKVENSGSFISNAQSQKKGKSGGAKIIKGEDLRK